MGKYNILHLTDWHLNDPGATEEKLRSGFYRDYINGLQRRIEISGIDKIDLLLCTGDFIDRGLTDNYVHAEEVLNYLIEKFSIVRKDVFLNIGNHDVSISGHKLGSKEEFLNFEKKFPTTYTKIYSDKIHEIIKLDNSIYILKLDSVFNENDEVNNDSTSLKIVYPSELQDGTIDKIVTNVEKLVLNDSLLIVTSHFPMIVNPRMTMILEDDKWINKHLWKSGMSIAKRIITNRFDKNILFLYGDGHLDNFWSHSERHHFFMTGMFGGNYVNNLYAAKGVIKSYNKTNDAKVIQYDVSSFDAPAIYNFTYLPEGYNYSAQHGEWKWIREDIRVEQTKIIAYPAAVLELKEKVKAKEDTKKEYVECISQAVQEKIIEEVRFKNLYTVSRTVTSEKESSLGWVSITNLFQNRELFCQAIEKMYEWIQINSIKQDETSLICGLGFWGAVFAAQLGARTGITSFSVSSKRVKTAHNHFESVESIKDELEGKEIKNIILITDVISTGTSILSLKKELIDGINAENAKWYALSVLSDKTQERLKNIIEFEKLGSLCISLPIPVIDNERLPDESIFPITFDFR
jgi:hypoxanthine-guanine phosphoribosyltransferase